MHDCGHFSSEKGAFDFAKQHTDREGVTEVSQTQTWIDCNDASGGKTHVAPANPESNATRIVGVWHSRITHGSGG